MPVLQRKQLTFQSGEISPRMFGRSDTDIYAQGLSFAENVILDKRGGAFKRNGLEHRARVAGNNARVFTLQVTRQQFYTMLLRVDPDTDEGELIIVAPGARYQDSNLLTNGSFLQGGTGWSTITTPPASRVLFSSGECDLLATTENPQFVVEPDFTQGGIAWETRVSHPASTVTFTANTCVLQPRQDNAADFAGVWQTLTTTNPGEVHRMEIVGNFAGTLRVRVGTGEGDGTDFDQEVTPENGRISVEFTPVAGAFTITLDCTFGNAFAVLDTVKVFALVEKLAGVSQQATVTATITDDHLCTVSQLRNNRITIAVGTTQGGNDIFEIESTSAETTFSFVPNSATYWVTVYANGDVDPEAIITSIGTAAEVDAGPVGLTMPAPWTDEQLNEVHIAVSPEGETVYFLHPNVAPHQLIYDFATNTFTLLAPCVFVSPPAAWAGINWPSTGCTFQGRLWLAGAPVTGRQTVWGSVSGSPLDFTKAPAEGSGALEFVLQELGKIEWILGTKNLLLGAENGEHIINSDGPVITDTDFKVEQQSSFGSNNMQASQVGEKVFYATPDGRQLREMGYQWQENNWLSQDLTFVSEHITRGRIKRSCWAQHPGSLFLVALEDGTIAALTYDRTAGMSGWTRLVLPGFFVYDIATARKNGRNEYIIVGRREAGQIDLTASAFDLQPLDSYVSKFYGNPGGGNVIDGLDHLEGKQVRILVDGAVDPPQTVVGGQVTATISGTQLYAGIGFSGKIVTLPPDVPQDQIRSWKKRWKGVYALMLSSKTPIINGVRPPDRTPSTPMDTVEPNRTTAYSSVTLGWDENGLITIEEPLPVEMNLLAIYGELAAESL